MNYDVIIIGGSFAGQAAALQLGRTRKRVLLVDAGKPRNRFARTSHGFPGQDGQTPAEILAITRQQLGKYATVQLRQSEVTQARAIDQGFRLSMADGREETGSRLIIATGVRDTLPDLPGLEARWGVSVVHCPYCHGYEFNQRPLGVLARTEMALHQAMLIPDWGPTTLFTQGTFTPAEDQQIALAARGVTIEQTPVAALLGEIPHLDAVRLVDGRIIELAGLFIAPQTEPASDLAWNIGCKFHTNPMGHFIVVDEKQQTTIPGVFAAGDAANPMTNIAFAVSTGVMAAVGAHHSLIYGIGEYAV